MKKIKEAKRVLALLLVLVLSLGSLSGCSGGKEAEEPGSEGEETAAQETGEMEQITVSVHPSGHGLPAYIADQMGFYEEEGLDVETLVYIGAPPQMEAYEAGAWDIGTTGFGGIILGVAKSSMQIIGSRGKTAISYWQGLLKRPAATGRRMNGEEKKSCIRRERSRTLCLWTCWNEWDLPWTT